MLIEVIKCVLMVVSIKNVFIKIIVNCIGDDPECCCNDKQCNVNYYILIINILLKFIIVSFIHLIVL